MTDSVSEMLLDQVAKLYAVHEPFDDPRPAELPAALWTGLEDIGVPPALRERDADGFGLGWSEIEPLLAYTAGRGEPVPIGDTVLSQAVLAVVGADIPDGPIALGSVVPNDRVVVPWGAAVPHVLFETVVRGESHVVLCATDRVDFRPFHGPVSEPRFVARIEDPERDAMICAKGAFRLAGGLLRAIQMSGALRAALALSLDYAMERRQFGRPIAKFQAVQHMLAELAAETAAASAAVQTACQMMDRGTAELAVAVAKVRAAQAATKGSLIAHQIHGAMGIALEYPLHRLTTRLWHWRDDFGSEHDWAAQLGKAALQHPAGNLWDVILAATDKDMSAAHG